MNTKPQSIRGQAPGMRWTQLSCWLRLAGVLLAANHVLADPFISEVLFNPPGPTDSTSEYIELRGTPNFVFPTGSYLVVVEGDTNSNPGMLKNVFDLSAKAIGGNGFLVLLQKGSPYTTHSNANLYINTGSGAGWGSGSTSSIGHRGESDQTEIENGSQTFFLLQAPAAPLVDSDIDTNNDGIPDGSIFASWVILDSVGIIDADADIAYGAITFRRNPNGIASGTIVEVGLSPNFSPSYVGRTGNTTGSAATDWVASDNLAGSAPNWNLGNAANTAPSGYAGIALNHVGGPNFGAPATPGVVVRETGRSTDVLEGVGTDSYVLALNTTPSGGVTIQIAASGQVQVSSDGGANFGSTRSVTLVNSNSPKTVVVRALDDSLVNVSPYDAIITHTVTSTGDPTRYPLSSPMPIVRVHITENDWVLLSELKVNPPGAEDTPYEYMEIRGWPNTVMSNVYLLAIEGDASSNPGQADVVVKLDNAALGDSGLLVITAPGHPYFVPNGTTVILAPQLSRSGGALGNGSISFLLVTSPTNIPEGVDLDAGDNGVLEGLPSGTTILDAVGWSDGDANDIVYGGVILTQRSGAADAATRFGYDDTPRSAAAWFNGDLLGPNGDSLAYDNSNVSADFPYGAMLTPGIFANIPPSANPPPAFSGVIGDPTNPGMSFTVNDAETDPSLLSVTASSSDPVIVPDQNLTIVAGTGAQRTLYLNPVGVGYATITLTVSDGDEIGQTTFAYAASAMGRPGGRFHTFVSDGSTAIAIDSELMLIGDDENQIIRLYRRNESGGPVQQYDLNPYLGLTDLYPNGIPKEVDIEGSTRVGNRIYWIGGHSHGLNAEARTNRARLFTTDLSGSGTNVTLSYVGRYDFLKVDLINWDINNLHGKGPNYYGLAESADPGLDAKAPDGSGFNIEGLCMAPNSTNTAYVAFRAPFVPPTNRLKALIVPVTNFNSVAISTAGPGSARFGPPIELDLDGHGIRSIEGNGTNYLIIAGPPDVATEVPPKDFRLFTWDGTPAHAPQQRAANLSGLIPEGIVELPASPWTDATQVQLICDNGITVYYGDGVQAKHLPYPAFKKFRSDWVTLGAVVTPPPRILSAAVVNGNCNICWKSVAGHTYRLQSKSSMGSGVWEDVAGDVVATDIVASKVVPVNGWTQRFYRVVMKN